MHLETQAAMKSDASAQMIMDGDNKIAALAISSKDGESLNIADPTVMRCRDRVMCVRVCVCVRAQDAEIMGGEGAAATANLGSRSKRWIPLLQG